MKAVLIAIQPKWCEKILNGEKTIEVRKTRPAIETPFKCYIYCTKKLEKQKKSSRTVRIKIPIIGGIYLNGGVCFDEKSMPGKVIGEFVCDEIEEFHKGQFEPHGKIQEAEQKDLEKLLKNNWITYDEVWKYREKLPYYKPLYCWHISDLKIYDKPKELREFRKEKINCFEMPCQCCKFYHEEKDGLFDCDNILTRPPRSWCYVE